MKPQFFEEDRTEHGWGRYYFHLEAALVEIRAWLIENQQIDKKTIVEWIPYSLDEKGSPILMEPVTNPKEIGKIMGVSKIISDSFWKILMDDCEEGENDG